MNSQLESKQKYFGNCKVKWQIDKFSFQTYAEEWFIQSPEFIINGSEERKWCMSLRPKLINGSSFVLFSVKKSALDSVSACTWLNVKIYKRYRAKFVCLKDKVLCIKNRSKYEVILGSIEYLLSQINKSDDLLMVVCHLIIYRKNKSRGFGECKDAGLKLLSENMLDLYSSVHNYDTRISIGGNVILAHKAILHARNEYLSCIIEDDDEFQDYNIINLCDFSCDGLDYYAMRKVLAYIYTGDIRHVLGEPSFALHRCVSFLEINDIELHYHPDELILISTIDFEEYSYILHGYEFENSHLIWHCCTKDSVETFRLLFYPERNNRRDFISLFTKTFEKSMFARLEFDFVAESDQKCTALIITDGNAFIDVDEITSGIIRNLDRSLNTFEVKIKVTLTAGIKISYIDEQSIVCVSCNNEDYYYECLSRDLEYLFDSGPLTDIVINMNGLQFEVHKCILASRCRLLLDLLEANEEAVVALNSDAYIIFVTLNYLYTGVLKDVIDDEIFEVYKTAVSLNLFQLQSICSDWLKISSKTNRNIRCRIVRIAEEYKDSSLMKSVLNDLFVKKARNSITDHSISFQDVSACRFCSSAF